LFQIRYSATKWCCEGSEIRKSGLRDLSEAGILHREQIVNFSPEQDSGSSRYPISIRPATSAFIL
jgi:hypothetical protein